MKKKVLIIFVLIFVSLFASSVFAAEGPGLYYDFYYEWDESWTFVPDTWSGTMCSFEYSENALKVNMEGGDPSIMVDIREPIDLAEYPFIKIRVKNESPTSGLFEMYISRDAEAIAEANNFKYEIGKEHTEFKDFIIDAKAVKGTWWTGELTTLRLDCLNNPSSDGGDVFYIEYMAFFKTQADAEAWTPDRSQTPAPTAEPTPTPTQSPDPTEKPATTPSPTKDKDTVTKDGGISTPVIVVSALIIVAAVVVAIVLIMKARKRG